jgi:translation initiation factor IF-1
MRRMIKVGKYTAALILVVVGSLLLIDLTTNTEFTGELIRWWPAVIILVGIEYLLLSTIYRGPDTKMRFAIGSLILALVLSIAVIGYTSFPNVNFLNSINIGNIAFSDKNGKSYDKGTTIVPVNDNQDKVHILNPNGDIEIEAGDVEDIQIATTLYVSKLKNDEADKIAAESSVEFQDNGGTIEIEAKGKEYRIFGIKQKPRMDMIITVPLAKAVDYEINMTNGKMEATGVAVKDSFKVDTTNGGITVSNIGGEIIAHTTNGTLLMENIRGDVELDTTNGTITANDVDGDVSADTTNGKIIANRISGKVEADTTNGSITLTDVLKKVTGDTTNGGITVRSTSLGGDWELDTTHGNIVIYLPEQANFEIKGSAGYKNIKSDFPLKISDREVSGSVGTAEHEITIDTNSKISIYKNTD